VTNLSRNLALLASLALIGIVTLHPQQEHHEAQLTELDDIVEALMRSDVWFVFDDAVEAVANVLLFMPLGAALALRGVSVRKAALYGSLLSVTVECMQLLFVPGRTVSLDDVLLNTVGAMAGGALVSAVLPARRRTT
jgi:VanZ family protein